MARIPTDVGKLRTVELLSRSTGNPCGTGRRIIGGGCGGKSQLLQKNLYSLMKLKTEQVDYSESELYGIGLLVAN